MCLFNYVFFLIFILFLENSTSSLSQIFSCQQQGTCSCLTNTGELVDLSPLNNTKHPIVAATESKLYIYHPCTDIPLVNIKNNTCHQGFGMCYFVPKNPLKSPIDYDKALSNNIPGNFTKLAENSEAVLRVNQFEQIEIVYKDHNVTTIVKLECIPKSEDFKLKIEKSEPKEHILILSTHYACINKEHYMSGAAVFFLIVFIFLGIYFVGGLLVLKFIRGATGVEMIPNHEFWSKVILSVKNGFLYLTTCGKNAPDSYEKI